MNEATNDEAACESNGFGLCLTHPPCDLVRATQRELWAKVEGLERELKARAEILDGIQKACGEGWWSGAMDWRQRLRDFAEDAEQHRISRAAWKKIRGNGITLYSVADYFTAYYDDAAVLWDAADDDHPMHHVMMQSDPPHRTVIHALHLAAWVQHLVKRCVPVQIASREMMDD